MKDKTTLYLIVFDENEGTYAVDNAKGHKQGWLHDHLVANNENAGLATVKMLAEAHGWAVKTRPIKKSEKWKYEWEG